MAFNVYEVVYRGNQLFKIETDSQQLLRMAEVVCRAEPVSFEVLLSFKYMFMTGEQVQQFKLLEQNGFFSKDGFALVRWNNEFIKNYSLEEALEAINRGEFVVESFLDKVDG
jgi:hypothetical protein